MKELVEMECLKSDLAWKSLPRARAIKGTRLRQSVDDDDFRIAGPDLPNQRVEYLGVGSGKPDTSMRSRRSEPRNRRCAMNRPSSIIENGERHRCIVICPRMPHPVHANRTPFPAWRDVSLTRGRDLPCVDHFSAMKNRHRLFADIDPGDKRRSGRCDSAGNGHRDCGKCRQQR